jgi:hypothetical protein
LKEAVQRVAAALGVWPDTVELPPGFVERAIRRNQPAVLTLGDIAHQLVFLGPRTVTDPDAAAPEFAREALLMLPAPSRAVTESVLPAWVDLAGEAFVAVFTVSADGLADQLCGTSWSPPRLWPRPMIDPGVDPLTNLDQELARLHTAATDRVTGAQSEASVGLSTQLIDQLLQIHGGERIAGAAPPPAGAGDRAWTRWLRRYEASVRAEWRRARGEIVPMTPPAEAEAGGPLSGRRVFVSYARADMSRCGWPVLDALLDSGATVWIDLVISPPPDVLDAGLAEVISGCEIFVLCATDEFFERAGYATQELAWALERLAAGGRLRTALAVVRPDTVLPAAISDWPLVEFDGLDETSLGPSLVSRLTAVTTTPAPMPAVASSRSPATELPEWADRSHLLRRVRHLRRYDEVDTGDALLQLVVAGADTRPTDEVRRRLLTVGDGLDWSGRLTDLEHWPTDPFVFDLRWRLGVNRVVATVRWPLTGSLDEPVDVTDDLDLLLTRPLPLLALTTAIGWGEDERRFAVRSHASRLRVLEQLFRRELTAGLLSVPDNRLHRWGLAVRERRQECVDALLAFRLGRRVGWRADPPLWDDTVRRLSALLRSGSGPRWDGPVPDEVLFTVLSNVDELSAAVADAAWVVSRQGGAAQQWLSPRGRAPVRLRAHAGEHSPIPNDGAVVQLGLVPGDGGAELSLGWSGIAGHADGVVGTPLAELRQAIAALNA